MSQVFVQSIRDHIALVNNRPTQLSVALNWLERAAATIEGLEGELAKRQMVIEDLQSKAAAQ